jgi:hypothetical protein
MIDYLGLGLVLMVISIMQFLVFRKYKSINIIQNLFISIFSSLAVIVSGVGGLLLVVSELYYKLILLLGGIDIADFLTFLGKQKEEDK